MLEKRYLRFTAGFILILIAIIAIFNSVSAKNPDQVLWFCYAALFIMGIGVITKNSTILVTELNILTIPFIFWIIDFFYVLFIGQPLWGITNYFFVPGELSPKLVSLQHLFTIPIALYFLYVSKITRRDAWKFSFLQVALVFALTFLLTKPANNVNCVFESCVSFLHTTGGFHPLAWFAVTFIGILITNFVIVRLPFLKKNFRQSNKK